MPLNNIRILSTKPLPQTIIVNAAEKGLAIDAESFIQTEAVNSKEVIDEIQSLVTKKITAIFTSTKGVEAVIAQLSSKPDWKIFCMGGATKELVSQFFGTKAIVATARDAESLANKIIVNKNTEEPVFFCGDQRLDTLPETLTASGLALKELIVYTTVYTPKLIQKNYDGVVFFSPSAVHSFF
ncbi:MAG: uroporphyrinogen-III synthase [Ferruginibacter sp.]